MNIKLKNLLGIFLSLFISHSLWSMEVPVKGLEILELPAEIQENILIQINITDLPNMLCTCQSLQKAVNEILSKKAHEYFGEDAAKYKPANMRWGAVFKEHFLMPSNVLKIDSWQKEELEFAISDERFAYHERHLLKHLEEMVTTRSIFKIDNGKDLAAALVAYDGFFIYTTCNIASDAVYHAVRDAARDDAFCAASNAARDAASDAALNAASDAASDATIEIALNAASDVASDAARNFASDTVRDTARNKTMHSLRIIVDIKDLGKIGKDSLKLSNLFVLAYISQRGFLKYFQNAFNAAKEKLDNDESFNMNKDEIIKIWEENTWGKEKLKSNPYILTLRNVALRWASQIED